MGELVVVHGNSKYDPEMGYKAMLLFAEGASQIEVATELGITYDTYLLYQKIYPDFLESIKKGLQLAQAWWMKQGRVNLSNPKFSYVGWSIQVKNRFRYRNDEQPVKLKGFKNAKTFTEKVNHIVNAAAAGKITPSEAKRLCDAVAIGAKVEEVTELKKIIEELTAQEREG